MEGVCEKEKQKEGIEEWKGRSDRKREKKRERRDKQRRRAFVRKRRRERERERMIKRKGERAYERRIFTHSICNYDFNMAEDKYDKITLCP